MIDLEKLIYHVFAQEISSKLLVEHDQSFCHCALFILVGCIPEN